jgi:hypothetical protein
VKTITALALAALAEAATLYGDIKSFDSVLNPLWYRIQQHCGKCLAAFLKAISTIIPLMDAEYGSYCAKKVMIVLIHGYCSHALDRYSLLCILGISYSLSPLPSPLSSLLLPLFFLYSCIYTSTAGSLLSFETVQSSYKPRQTQQTLEQITTMTTKAIKVALKDLTEHFPNKGSRNYLIKLL